MYYTQNDREKALQVSFIDVCQYFGYSVFRVGKYYSLKEMDSIRIYNDKTYYRWSDRTGGTLIDFLIKFCGYDNTYSCIKFLLEFQKIGFERKEIDEKYFNKNYVNKDGLSLPAKADNYSRLYAYLIKKRKISKETVDYFVKQNKIYEEKEYHNIVFLGYDQETIKYASKHGTNTLTSLYKGDCIGSNKDYGFSLKNKKSEDLYVFEAAIDLMSYIDLTKKYDVNALALGGVASNALQKFLDNNSNIKNINLFMDSDEPGMAAMHDIFNKYSDKYDVTINVIKEKECKDINELLQKFVKDNINFNMIDNYIYKINGISNVRKKLDEKG